MSSRRFLWVVLCNILLAGVLLQMISTRLYLAGKIPAAAANSTVIHELRDLVHFEQGDDSWTPMLAALSARHAPQGIYGDVFFDHHIKFQYPLSSLLPLLVLQRLQPNPDGLLLTLKVLSVAALLGTVVLSVLAARRRDWLSAAILAFSFAPLIKGYALGQVQVFIDLIFAACFLFWDREWEGAAGFGIGLIALVKPQFCVILAWGLLRKRWRFSISGFSVVAVGTALACLLFGLRNNLQYFGPLRYMSARGETYFANQSFNGVLNRLWRNGNDLAFDLHGFPSFHWPIYLLTVATSLALFAWCISLRAPHSPEGRMLDFSLVAIAATAASPIAWEHHYGILLPILLWTVSTYLTAERWSRARAAAFLTALLLVTDNGRFLNVFSGHVPLNVVQSALFGGVLLLVAVLTRARSEAHAPRERSTAFTGALVQMTG